MAAAKPQIPISQLLDMIGKKFISMAISMFLRSTCPTAYQECSQTLKKRYGHGKFVAIRFTG